MKKVTGIIIGIATAAVGVLAVAAGAVLRANDNFAVIGGADGPTSVFVAGKIDGAYPVGAMGIGIVLIGIGCYCLFHKRK